MFFNESWVDRCDDMHDEEEKKILTQWCEIVLDEMMNGESEARRHTGRTKLDIDRAHNESIRSWMLGALKMKRKLKKYPQDGIR